MNDRSIDLLAHILFQFERTVLTHDPEYLRLRQAADEQYQAFRGKYEGDRPFITELNRVLDAYTDIEEYEKDFQLRLGLQLGLEVGGMNWTNLP